MGKIMLIGNGQVLEFESAEEMQKYVKENNITDIQIAMPTYKPELPPTIEEFYDKMNYTPSVARMAPMSGQDRRRERRAKERQNKKR